MGEAGYFVECGDTMPNKLRIASRRAILYADTEAFAGNIQPLKDLYRQIVIKI